MIGAVPDVPHKTWSEVVDELRQAKGMTQDDLAYEARQHGAPSTLTGSWISALKNGTRPLSADILAGMAGALGVAPETFVEYRLAIARARLDEREVGLEEALKALAVAEGAAAAEAAAAPAAEGEAAAGSPRSDQPDRAAPAPEDQEAAAARKAQSRKRAA